MIYKISTLSELAKVKTQLPTDVYNKIHAIVAMLEKEYGDDRDSMEADGGIVVYADTQAELAEAIKELHFGKKTPELVDTFGGFTNTLFFRHNEWAANFIAPRESKDNLKRLGVKYDV